MKNKLILVSIFIFTSLSICGCWDNIELRNREIVSGIGLDKEEQKGKILLTVQSLIPQNLGTPAKPALTQGNSVHVISVAGDSIADGLKSYRKQISKSVYLQHNRIVVIGEDVAREGLTSKLDFFLRYDESRSRSLVLVCKGRASDILNWNSEELTIPSDFILELITAPNKLLPPLEVDVHKLSLKLFSKTTSPIITRVEIVPQKSGPPHLVYAGAGVFNKDKLVGWLDVNETQVLLWLTNEANRGIMEGFFPRNQDKTISQRVTSIKTKITPQLDNGNITISLEVNEEGSLIEKDSKEEINSPDAIKAIEASLNTKLKKDIEACLRKVQKEYKTDVLGFGEAIHRKYPKEWKKLEANWPQLYPDVKVEVKVNAKVRGTGLIIDSFKK